MKMRSKACKLSCRSVRDVFVLMLLVFLVSTLITIYNIVRYLPWLKDEQLTLHWERSAGKLYYMQESGTHGGYGHRPFQQQLRSHRETTHSKKPSQILTTLLKLQGTIFSDRRSWPTAILWLSSESTNQETEQYSKALKRLGFQVQFVEPLLKNQHNSKNYKLQKYLRLANWTLFLCFSFGSGCLQNMNTSKLHSFQKVNNIPELLQLVTGKERLCQLIETTRRIPDWIGGLYQSPCYHVSDLPFQNDQLLQTYNDTWWGVYVNVGGAVHQLQLLTREKLKFLKSNLPDNTVLQPLPGQFMLLNDQAVFLRVFVSVTSLQPLRSYLHTEAISLRIVNRQYGLMTLESSNKMVKLWHLFQEVTHTHGPAAAETLLSRLKFEIISLLMLAETLVTQSTANRSNETLCPNCFQMLQLDLTFDTNFRPFILDVQSLPAGDQHVEFPTPFSVIQDSLNMVLQESGVTIDVAYGLDELGWDVGLMGSQCNTIDKLCLNDVQLLYLLESRAESLNMGAFIRLYPSEESGILNGLVRQLQHFLLQSRQDKWEKKYNTIGNMENHPRRQGPILHTSMMHPLLLRLEKFYASNSNKAYLVNPDDQELSDSYEDSNIPKKVDLLSQPTISVTNAKIVEKQFQQADDNKKKYLRPTCSDDPLDMAYLMNIMTEPEINITPKFDSSVVSYEASVPYELLLVKIWAFARSCQCEAKMDDKFGVSRPANYTLGVGTNRVTLVVVDITHPVPLVVNTYIVHIHRRTLPGAEFNKHLPHSVCSLKQDCSLKFVPNVECGLQNTAFDSWPDLLSYTAILPPCVSSDMPGQWVVPCNSCSPDALCYWQKAIWQPKSCTYRWIPRNKLKKCFAGKKLLFLGDSTNRGIMHYMLEQVNGTLQEWDKTHDIKLYSNLNNHKTSMSFAYYPQFWLPTDHRPTFDKAFYQLVRKNLPLENSTNTSLVIGGVHWLDKRHVDIIKKGLQREGLTGIKLIIKDLGAGFHQPVEGLHCLTQKEQQKLLFHNIALTSYARQHGFHVVETFNMTMGRYKDFLQGQCACHFHRVVVQKKPKQSCGHRCPSHRSHQPKISSTPSFHVEGEINAVYSEMMITQICSHMIYDGV